MAADGLYQQGRSAEKALILYRLITCKTVDFKGFNLWNSCGTSLHSMPYICPRLRKA